MTTETKEEGPVRISEGSKKADELINKELSEEIKSAIAAMKRVRRMRLFQPDVKLPKYRYVRCP